MPLILFEAGFAPHASKGPAFGLQIVSIKTSDGLDYMLVAMWRIWSPESGASPVMVYKTPPFTQAALPP